MKWIITANTNECCIYEYDKKVLQLFKELHHPENKLQNIDLVTDKSGQYDSRASHGTYSSRKEPKDIKIETFVKGIAEELNEKKKQYIKDQIVLIMPAKIEGLLTKNLEKEIKDLIAQTIHKNIMYMSFQELNHFINEKVH